MGVRELLTVIGGTTMACSLPARAQERVRRIGALLPATADDPEFQTRIGAFQPELGRLGWIIGKNVRIDIRWVRSRPTDVRKHAAEVVTLAPDVVLTFGAVTVGPLLQEPRTVPIVPATVLARIDEVIE